MSTVRRDPDSGVLQLTGELDFVTVPTARAELAVLMDSAGPHVVDLSTLSVLAAAGVTLLEELLDRDVRLSCAFGCPAYRTLDALELLDRVEIVAAG